MPEVNDLLESVNDVLTDPLEDELKALPQEAQQALRKVLPRLAEKANRQAEANKAKVLDNELNELKTEFKKRMDEELQKIRDANKPPSPDELQKLLNQEYIEFNIRVRSESTERMFTIRELSQKVEKQLYKRIQTSIVPHLKKISSLEFTKDPSVANKLQQILDVVPEALDTMAECCVTILDPYGDEKLDKDWVQDHLSSYRITSVLQAWMAAGRVRDFFSGAFQLIPGQTIG